MPLTIRVASAAATGVTSLAAFDRALRSVGAQDVNLVAISSVIPAGSDVIRATAPPGEYRAGDRLYCVLAYERVTEPGAQAWAGLAWSSDAAGRGGVFIEAHGPSEHLIRYELEAGLQQMVEDRPYWDLGEPDYEVVGVSCDHEPVCALALAAFQAESW